MILNEKEKSINISEYYNLNIQQTNLEFVDVNLNSDNKLFIDPRLIESVQNPYTSKMLRSLEVYWSEIIKGVRSKDDIIVRYLLSGLSEPNETHLGYAVKGNGKAVGNKLVEGIFQTLKNNLAVKTGILRHLSDIELFFPEIGSDRISDMTTKIIKSVLIEFTQDQCAKYDIKTESCIQKDIFDFRSKKWITKEVELPSYNNKPGIFVPKTLVRLGCVSRQNVNCFYRFAISQFIINDPKKLVDITPTGKEGNFLVKDVQSKFPNSKELLAECSKEYSTMLIDFKSYKLKDRVHSLSDKEISEVVYKPAS